MRRTRHLIIFLMVTMAPFGAFSFSSSSSLFVLFIVGRLAVIEGYAIKTSSNHQHQHHQHNVKQRLRSYHQQCYARTKQDVVEDPRHHHPHHHHDDDDDSCWWGPPSPLRNLVCGERITAVRRITTKNKNGTNMTTTKTKPLEIQRVSSQPPLFVMRQILSRDECRALIQQATESKMMEPAMTISGDTTNVRHQSFVSWLPLNNNASSSSLSWIQQELTRTVSQLVLSRAVWTKRPNAGCEDVQVVHYHVSGEYTLHHDGVDRIVTVLYYLENSGATWFPFANIHDNELHTHNNTQPTTREEALAEAQHLVPGRDGLLLSCCEEEEAEEDDVGNNDNENFKNSKHVISLQAGDAVIFYNSKQPQGGMVANPHSSNILVPDWSTMHAGMPTSTDNKWIANHWFRG